MIGVPVIINHQDVSKENADEIRRGVVSDVWYNPEINWFECAGVIWDETAQNLITDKGWSVSCSYDVKLADDAGGTENNIPYDIEFLDGVFTHLAIVDNPRYERANIVFNSKTVINNQFKEEDHPRDETGKFTSGSNSTFYNETTEIIELKGDELGSTDEEIRENGLKYFKEKYQGKKFDNPELKGILFSNPGIKKFYTNSADIHKIKAIPALKDIIEKGEYQGAEDLVHPRKDGIIKFHRINHDVAIDGHQENMSVLIGEDKNGNKFYNLNHRTYIVENSSRGERAIGVANEEFSINIITQNVKNFNPKPANIRKNEVQNNKEQDMALIDELKKLITKVENDKGEDMDDKEKVENEKVDKRKLIDEVAGIMKSAGADDEKIRTAIAKMEKLAYDKSEAGTADNEKEDEPKDDKPADNSKVKNEETKEDEKKYDDLKKEVKEDVQNRCKNSVDNAKGGYFDKMNEIYNAAIQPAEENTYISREQKLKYAEEYFAK